MAGPTKRPKKPSNAESGDDSMSDESEEGTYHGQSEIQATFEGRNPEGQDFHGIKQLLLQLFLKAHIDLSQLSDMLINQVGIGSVLKQSTDDDDMDEEDENDVMDLSSDPADVFGITSVINLTSHKDADCVKHFYMLLEQFSNKHASKDQQEKIKDILTNCNRLGFLINERFVNIPAKISAIMLDSLYHELERIKRKDASYDFEYFVMICKTCKPKGEENGEVIFSNDEETVFEKASDISFDFSVENQSDTSLSGKWLAEDKQMIPYRKVLIFKGNKFKTIVDEVTTLVQ